MGYLLFKADQNGFDDGEGNEVSLGDRLGYLDDNLIAGVALTQTTETRL